MCNHSIVIHLYLHTAAGEFSIQVKMSFAETTLRIIKFLWKIICLCATKIYEGILFIFFITKTFASASWEHFDTSRDEQQRLAVLISFTTNYADYLKEIKRGEDLKE